MLNFGSYDLYFVNISIFMTLEFLLLVEFYFLQIELIHICYCLHMVFFYEILSYLHHSGCSVFIASSELHWYKLLIIKQSYEYLKLLDMCRKETK